MHPSHLICADFGFVGIWRSARACLVQVDIFISPPKIIWPKGLMFLLSCWCGRQTAAAGGQECGWAAGWSHWLWCRDPALGVDRRGRSRRSGVRGVLPRRRGRNAQQLRGSAAAVLLHRRRQVQVRPGLGLEWVTSMRGVASEPLWAAGSRVTRL